MRYELKRLDILGAQLADHPHHNLRHLALKDAILSCGAKEVLVLGCGKGLVEYLLPNGFRCISLDIDKKQIEAALEINRYKPNRQFLVADVFQTEAVLGAQKYPIVVISEVIEHLEDDRRALESACRHLLPGGWLVITVPNADRFHNRILRLLGRNAFLMTSDHVREYTLRAALRLLGDAGYRVIKWKGIWFDFPRPYSVERYIAPYSKIRSVLAALFPGYATYLLFVCKYSAR